MVSIYMKVRDAPGVIFLPTMAIYASYLGRANAQILHGDIFFLRACYFHVTRLANVALTTFLGPADLDRSTTYKNTR